MHISEIRKQRLVQINKTLSDFTNLPPSLQTEKYKKYLIDTKEFLKPIIKELVVPSNKVGKIIGQGGKVLKEIERDYKCKIKIDSSHKTEYVLEIEGEKTDKVIQNLEDILYNTKKLFNLEEMTDWQKFYVWWAYHNKKYL